MDHEIVIQINTSNEKVLRAVVEHIMRSLRQKPIAGLCHRHYRTICWGA